jgi:hypothetical protein
LFKTWPLLGPALSGLFLEEMTMVDRAGAGISVAGCFVFVFVFVFAVLR